MLGSPPPGFNTQPINRQTVAGPAALTVPGIQGLQAQGYNPTSSSYAMPSSAHYPSALPRFAGTPGGAMPPGAPMQQQMMARALARPQQPAMR
jgi:hypothetical protein